jgi:hypothetical protein
MRIGMKDSVSVEELLDPHFSGGLFVVPNELRDRINRVLDAALEGQPPEAQAAREMFYEQLLQLYNEKGYVPDDISIVPKENPNAG